MNTPSKIQRKDFTSEFFVESEMANLIEMTHNVVMKIKTQTMEVYA